MSLTKVADGSLGDGHDHRYANQPVIQSELAAGKFSGGASGDNDEGKGGEEEVGKEHEALKVGRARARVGRYRERGGVHDARRC